MIAVFPTRGFTEVAPFGDGESFLIVASFQHEDGKFHQEIVQYRPTDHRVVGRYQYPHHISEALTEDQSHGPTSSIVCGTANSVWLLIDGDSATRQPMNCMVEHLDWATKSIVATYAIPAEYVGYTEMVPTEQGCILLHETDNVTTTTKATFIPSKGEIAHIDLGLGVGEFLEAVDVRNGILVGLGGHGSLVTVSLDGLHGDNKARMRPLLDPSDRKAGGWAWASNLQMIDDKTAIVGMAHGLKDVHTIKVIDVDTCRLIRDIELDSSIMSPVYRNNMLYGISFAESSLIEFDMMGKTKWHGPSSSRITSIRWMTR